VRRVPVPDHVYEHVVKARAQMPARRRGSRRSGSRNG
jgi:hypothetical protein